MGWKLGKAEIMSKDIANDCMWTSQTITTEYYLEHDSFQNVCSSYYLGYSSITDTLKYSYTGFSCYPKVWKLS